MLQNEKVITGNKAGDLFLLSNNLETKTKLDTPTFRNIRHIDFGIDSNKIFIFSDDFGIYTFDLEKEKVCEQGLMEGHLDIMTSVDCLTQKSIILSASLDGTVRLWDVKSGQNKVLYENKEVDTWSVKYYESLDKVVIGDDNGKLSILDYK